jgi:hypothetical protein
MARPAPLAVDDFWSARVPALEAQGWLFTTGSRYDPTHLEGVTPGGRSFTADMTGNADGSVTATLVVAGRTKQVSVSAGKWDGGTCKDLLTQAWLSFPASQR